MYVMPHSVTRCWYVCSILILWLWIVHCMYVIHNSDTRCWYVCSILIPWLCIVCMYAMHPSPTRCWYVFSILTYSMIVDSKLHVCMYVCYKSRKGKLHMKNIFNVCITVKKLGNNLWNGHYVMFRVTIEWTLCII